MSARLLQSSPGNLLRAWNPTHLPSLLYPILLPSCPLTLHVSQWGAKPCSVYLILPITLLGAFRNLPHFITAAQHIGLAWPCQPHLRKHEHVTEHTREGCLVVLGSGPCGTDTLVFSPLSAVISLHRRRRGHPFTGLLRQWRPYTPRLVH